jgi:hypothetical protein
MKKLIICLFILIPFTSYNQTITPTTIKNLEDNYNLKFLKINNQHRTSGGIKYDTICFFKKGYLDYSQLISNPLIINDTIYEKKLDTYLNLLTGNKANATDSIFKCEYINNLSSPGKSSILLPFYIKTGYVTNEEYREFENYVRDSIARRKLGEMWSDFLIVETSAGIPIDPPLLNWEPKIKWDDWHVHEMLEQMYLPEHERFYRKDEIDTRNLNYIFGKDTTNIAPDTISWVRHDNYFQGNNIKDAVSSFYHWHPYFNDYPAEGLNSKQIKAFLSWRTKFHQKMLDKQGIPLKVEYSLPSYADLNVINSPVDSLFVPVSDLPGNFIKITNRQYQEFVTWIKDSLIRYKLGENDIRYFITEDRYGMSIYPPYINWKTPIDYNNSDVTDKIKYLYLPCCYSGKNKKFNDSLLNYEFYFFNLTLVDSLKKEYRDRAAFITRLIVNVCPDTAAWIKKYNVSANKKIAFGDKQFNDSLIAGISYSQAFAYYHWRIYHKDKISLSENPLKNKVIPSERQWNKYYSITGRTNMQQSLENGVDDFKYLPYTYEYDKPTNEVKYCDYKFRYVVRFYPK